MAICHVNKLIFVHVPKNAGTSILSYFNSTPESILPDQSWKEYSLFYKEWNSYTTFSIIRDPYSRFKSFYKYLRIGPHINHFAKIVRDNYMVLTRPQSFFICDKNNIMVDKLVRYENLEKELSSVGIHNLPRKNVSKTIPEDRLLMNQETIDIINTLYKRDFDLFGYERR